MTKDDIDTLFLEAVKQGIKTDENQRYIYTKMVMEFCALMVEELGAQGYGTLAIAAQLRKEAP